MKVYYYFDISEFNSEELLDEYINYRIDNSDLLQKDIVEKIKIPMATFTRTKKKGYHNNPKVCDALIKYFKIKTEVSNEFVLLQKEINTLFTYIYFNNPVQQQKSFDRLLEIYKNTKDSPLEVITIALISIAMNTTLYGSDLSILDNNVDLIKYFLDKVNHQNKTLLIYSLYEYALHKKDRNLAIHYGKDIETLIPRLNDKFGVLMNYAIMNTCFFSRDFLKGIIYANKVINYQNVCYSPVIRTTAVYALTTFYSMLKDYDKIISTAENEILYLQFDEEHQLQYFGMVTALIMAYMVKGKYDEAFELINILAEYDFNEHKGIPPVYHKQLNDRKKMMYLAMLFMYNKLHDEEKFNATLDIINSDGDEDRKLYAEMILLLKKPNKTNIKQLGRMLHEASENKMLLAYSNIHYVIVKEYETYKYSE